MAVATPEVPAQRPSVPAENDLAAFEAVRAKNGLRVLIFAYATMLIAFIILLYFFATLKTLTASDVIAIFGIVTSVVGTLVGTFFGVSAANGARDASIGQATNAANLAQQTLDHRS
jgi:hypothetical protein